MSSRRPSQLKKQAVELAGRPTLNFFELAGLIADLHDRDPALIVSLPQESGMSRRRLYYLLDVGRLIEAHEISNADAEEIGWTKLQIIARHMGKTDAANTPHLTDLLGIASEHKARDLPAVLRGKRVAPKRIVHFYLNLGARAELREALLKFGAEPVGKGLRNKEAALVRLVRAATEGPSSN